MAEPLHLQPDPEPETEQVRLGNDLVELDSESARIVRNYCESLAAQYGASLEEQRRQALQSIGTQQPPPAAFPGQGLPPPPDLPDPDLLFRDKNAWNEDLGRSVDQRILQARVEANQQAQGLAQAFQQELARRDAVQEAKRIHDAAMQDMLDRRGLTENTRIVQAIYTEQYDKLKHLPLEMALDKIGAEAQAEIERIRAGEKWTMTPAGTQAGVTSRPPAQHLRSARRASRAPVAPPSEAESGLQEPGGGLGLLGRMIRTRQAQLTGQKTA